MCSTPVTFGGGTAIEKFSSGVPAGVGMEEPGLQPALGDARLDLGRLVAGAVLQSGHVTGESRSGALLGRGAVQAAALAAAASCAAAWSFGSGPRPGRVVADFSCGPAGWAGLAGVAGVAGVAPLPPLPEGWAGVAGSAGVARWARRMARRRRSAARARGAARRRGGARPGRRTAWPAEDEVLGGTVVTAGAVAAGVWVLRPRVVRCGCSSRACSPWLGSEMPTARYGAVDGVGDVDAGGGHAAGHRHEGGDARQRRTPQGHPAPAGRRGSTGGDHGATGLVRQSCRLGDGRHVPLCALRVDRPDVEAADRLGDGRVDGSRGLSAHGQRNVAKSSC